MQQSSRNLYKFYSWFWVWSWQKWHFTLWLFIDVINYFCYLHTSWNYCPSEKSCIKFCLENIGENPLTKLFAFVLGIIAWTLISPIEISPLINIKIGKEFFNFLENFIILQQFLKTFLGRKVELIFTWFHVILQLQINMLQEIQRDGFYLNCF